MAYSAKRAIADLAFIDAYARMENLPGSDPWFESFIDALSRIEIFVREGNLLKGKVPPEALSGFLYDVGFVRGSIWRDKISYAASEAMKNVVSFITEHEEWCVSHPEPKEEMLSDHARSVLFEAAGEGKCLFRPGLSGEVDATPQAIARYVQQELGATDRDNAEQWAEEARQAWEAEQTNITKAPVAPAESEATAEVESIEPNAVADAQGPVSLTTTNPFNPSGRMGRREWTPEQRAAQAERARGSKTPPFDDDLDAVKLEFNTGLSMDAIGKKWGCSGGHIRNFLTRHGIDPRRGHPRSRKGDQPPSLEEPEDAAFPVVALPVFEEEVATEAVDSPVAALSAVDDEPHVTQVPEPEFSSDHTEADLRITVPIKHRSNLLNDDDWPDIKARLDRGDSHRAIAGDYDVDPLDLEFFVSSNQRREAKSPPGEARAPLRA